MLAALRAFLDEISGAPARARPFEAADYRLAAAALLVHLAAIDGVCDAGETQLLHRLVETRFGLDPAAASALIAAAAESEREAVDLYRFTSVLKRTLDEDGRRAVIGMLWEMAYADGEVHEFEENVIWRVAELLGVSSRDRVALRQAAKDAGKSAGEDAGAPTTPGPWGG
jgi:uncharacterized tellurite resistance protein B-like protein